MGRRPLSKNVPMPMGQNADPTYAPPPPPAPPPPVVYDRDPLLGELPIDTSLQVKVKRLHPAATLPRYATDGAACFDIAACIDGGVTHFARAGKPAVVGTGLAFEVPRGHVMLVYSRSGHGFKHNTRLANCVGVIDSDYRGELMVSLVRDDSTNQVLAVNHGDRIAQAMIVPLPVVSLVEVDDLSDTGRGTGGLGSTGK